MFYQAAEKALRGAKRCRISCLAEPEKPRLFEFFISLLSVGYNWAFRVANGRCFRVKGLPASAPACHSRGFKVTH